MNATGGIPQIAFWGCRAEALGYMGLSVSLESTQAGTSPYTHKTAGTLTSRYELVSQGGEAILETRGNPVLGRSPRWR